MRGNGIGSKTPLPDPLPDYRERDAIIGLRLIEVIPPELMGQTLSGKSDAPGLMIVLLIVRDRRRSPNVIPGDTSPA
jgi:hypothetical protein